MALQRGFTLLEMLVVMLLLGLITTLALPAMQRWHDAVQNKAQVAQIIDSLRAAGFSAGASRRDIVVDSDSFKAVQPPAAATTAAAQRASDAPGSADAAAVETEVVGERLALQLPNGWQAEKVDEIRFLANGLCRPGSLQFRTEHGDIVTVEVRGPICGVELAQATGSGAQ